MTTMMIINIKEAPQILLPIDVRIEDHDLLYIYVRIDRSHSRTQQLEPNTQSPSCTLTLFHLDLHAFIALTPSLTIYTISNPTLIQYIIYEQYLKRRS